MAEVHTTITGSKGEVTVVVHNPAQPPLQTGAGTPVVAATKVAGQPNGSAKGQVSSTTVVFNNPA